jgi:outer membrane protein OmpA-like peptidoglycan-associated protein
MFDLNGIKKKKDNSPSGESWSADQYSSRRSAEAMQPNATDAHHGISTAADTGPALQMAPHQSGYGKAMPVLSETEISEQPQPQIQTKLEVEDEYPQDYMDKLLPDPKGEDPSRSLTPAQRLKFVGGLVDKLTPHFGVESSGEIKPRGSKKESELVKDDKRTASCCFHIMTRPAAKNKWQIVVADHLSPHTLDRLHTVLINSDISPVTFGYHTKKDEKKFYDKPQVILGHELCGHAALEELKAHPEGKRAVTNVHDPTVNIENAIAGEQGTPEELHRGLAKDGVHGGESFGKMTINHFKLNMSSLSSLPPEEREKMTMLSDMIKRFDLFVEIRGHSDNVGSEKAKQDVSNRRAFQAFLFLRKMGVSLRAKVRISEDASISIKRFLLKGMSDKEPPAGVDPADQDKFRRVDVFISSFPKGMSGLPGGVKKSDLGVLNKLKEIEEPKEAKDLKDKGTPCEKLLVGKAYP